MSWMRRKEIEDTRFVRMNDDDDDDDEYQLTNYVGTGETGSDASICGNGILVQSQIEQHPSSARTCGT